MVFPLIPLAMYAPAAIAGIGAAAKGLSGGRGQRILQSGMNLANRGLTSLQNVAQPYMKNIADKFMQSGPLTQAFTLDTASRPSESIAVESVSLLLKSLMKSAKYIKANDEEKEQMIKNAAEYLGIDIEAALEQAGQELLEAEEPSIPEKKKGGYVKKQRKRKHYRASSFVKMKKKKKYKKKYIKT